MNLTTTSYAILGHLAMQPWSMYDLARQMRRNVHYFFARAESAVYAEPRKLVDAGLAVARNASDGARPRTVYAITDAGRAELARWLALPVGKGPVLDFEGLLRVFLAPGGREQDLMATLSQVRQDIAGLIDLAENVGDDYLAGQAPFQRYVLVRAMVHDFLFSYADLIDRWAERSMERMQQWPDQTPAQREAAALASFRVRSRRRTAAAPGKPRRS
jgi:PadR family transcriptional regulator, regulatory protein AphA